MKVRCKACKGEYETEQNGVRYFHKCPPKRVYRKVMIGTPPKPMKDANGKEFFEAVIVGKIPGHRDENVVARGKDKGKMKSKGMGTENV